MSFEMAAAAGFALVALALAVRAGLARRLIEAMGLFVATGAALGAALFERADTAVAVVLFAAIAALMLAGLGEGRGQEARRRPTLPALGAAAGLAGLTVFPGAPLESVGSLLAYRAGPETGMANAVHAVLLVYWPLALAGAAAGLAAGAAAIRVLLAPDREGRP